MQLKNKPANRKQNNSSWTLQRENIVLKYIQTVFKINTL